MPIFLKRPDATEYSVLLGPIAKPSKMLKTLAQVISFVFHPLLVLTYMLVLLLLVNPYMFGVSSLGVQAAKILIIQVFLYTFVLPALVVVMLKALGFVQSIELKDRQERIGPYIVTGLFYLWMFINLYYNSRSATGTNLAFVLQIPDAYNCFVLGATIALFLAFFLNNFTKISAHAVGMGGLLAMVVITMLSFSYDTFAVNSSLLGSFELSMQTVLIFTILVAGLVGTARLILEAHEPMDLWGGFLVGFASQFIALRIVF